MSSKTVFDLHKVEPIAMHIKSEAMAKKRPRPYTYNMFSNMFWVVKKAISAISTTCFCTKCNKCQGPTTLTLLLSFCLNGFVLESLMTFIIANKISVKPTMWLNIKKVREQVIAIQLIIDSSLKIQIQQTHQNPLPPQEIPSHHQSGDSLPQKMFVACKWKCVFAHGYRRICSKAR